MMIEKAQEKFIQEVDRGQRTINAKVSFGENNKEHKEHKGRKLTN